MVFSPALGIMAQLGAGDTGPGDEPYAFSISGLKTAAARWIEKHWLCGEEVSVDDGAAALQEAVAHVLTRKALGAC